MRKISNEVLTGTMILACVALFVFFMFKTGKIGLRPETYQLKAVFNTASGLEKNAPVMLAGVEVGQVKDIVLEYGHETRIILDLQLEKRAQIRQDSIASISTMGLMGEKYVEISRGSAGSPFLEPDSTVYGEDPFDFGKIAKKGEEIAETLDVTLKDVRVLVANLNGVVGENKPGVDSIVADLEVTAKNFKEFSDDIKRHPWKLLIKSKEKKPRKTDSGTDRRKRRR